MPPEASARLLRVPAGFMRNKTQDRIEGVAAERGLQLIDLALVEEAIEIGRKIMEETIAREDEDRKNAYLNEVSPRGSIAIARDAKRSAATPEA